MEDSFEKSKSPTFRQFAKGYAQTRLAQFSTAREAVVWAFQGADNMVSAILEEKQVSFNKKNHKDKWAKFALACPEFLQRVPADQIDQCRRMWEDARYRDKDVSGFDAGQVVAVANRVFEFGLRLLAQCWAVSAEELREHVQAASESELAVVNVKEIDDYHRAREANIEQNGTRWGLAQYAVLLADPATYTHFSLQTDEPEVQRLIETTPDVAEKIAEAYKAFVEAITGIAFGRIPWEAVETLMKEKASEEEKRELLERVADAFEFNVLVRFSFLGYNFLENVEQVGEVVKALKEGRVEFKNPKVVRESSPRIVRYDTKMQKGSDSRTEGK